MECDECGVSVGVRVSMCVRVCLWVRERCDGVSVILGTLCRLCSPLDDCVLTGVC